MESIAVVTDCSVETLNSWFCRNPLLVAELLYWTPLTRKQDIESAIQRGSQLAHRFI